MRVIAGTSRLNMQHGTLIYEPGLMISFFDYDVVSASPSRIEASFPEGYRIVLYGSFSLFTNELGEPDIDGGTLTGLEIKGPSLAPMITVDQFSYNLLDFIDDFFGATLANFWSAALAGNDQFFGSAAGDWIVSYAGNDTLRGGAGNDTLDGGADIDTAALSGNIQAYTAHRVNASTVDVTGPDGTDRLINIELVAFDGGPTVDIGQIPPAAQSLPSLSVSGGMLAEGNAGQTELVFTVFLSLSPAATVSVHYATADGTAQAGSDYLAVSGSLTFTPDLTSQSVIVPILGDTMIEGNETFVLTLANAAGATLGTAAAAGVILNDDGGALAGDGNANILSGSPQGDSINGNAGNDTIIGSDGDDVIDGGSGDDLIAADLGANPGNDVVLGGPDNDIVWAGGGNDSVDGGAGNDILIGEGGSDWLVGRTGNDIFYGGDGADTLDGGDGNDIFAGDLLGEAPGGDSIVGGPGDDAFFGLAGNDTLIGGPGIDSFLGGPGADLFVYESGFGPLDAIWDFNPAEGDRIRIAAGINGTAISTPQQAAAAVVAQGGNGFIVLGGETIIVVGVPLLQAADFLVG